MSVMLLKHASAVLVEVLARSAAIEIPHPANEESGVCVEGVKVPKEIWQKRLGSLINDQLAPGDKPSQFIPSEPIRGTTTIQISPYVFYSRGHRPLAAVEVAIRQDHFGFRVHSNKLVSKEDSGQLTGCLKTGRASAVFGSCQRRKNERRLKDLAVTQQHVEVFAPITPAFTVKLGINSFHP